MDELDFTLSHKLSSSCAGNAQAIVQRAQVMALHAWLAVVSCLKLFLMTLTNLSGVFSPIFP
jgi:hypothetical protein